MPYCKNCGAELPEGAGTLCANCAAEKGVNAPLSGEEITKKMNRSAKPVPADAPAGLDRRAFLKTYSLGARSCVAAAIFGYISTAITLLISFTGYLEGNLLTLIDAAILLTLSLLVHSIKSRIAAILFLLYGTYNLVFFLISSGEFRGWLIVLAGVAAVYGAFQCAREWREYQARTAENAA